ncbi:hypothetical protein R5P42_004578 [Escherichia coli]|nr:hypothetical protein [Escherichia coli]
MKIINTTVKDSTSIIPSTDNHPTTLEKKGMNSLLTEIITKRNCFTALECQNQNVDEITEENLPLFNKKPSSLGFAKTNVSPEYITQYLQLADTYNDMDSLNHAILLANNSTKLVSDITKDPELEKDLSAQIANLIIKLKGMDNVFSQLRSDFQKTPAKRESSESALISSDGGILSSFSAIPAKVNQQIIDLFVCILHLSLSRLESELNISSQLCGVICSIIDSRCHEAISQAKKKMAAGIAKSASAAIGATIGATMAGVDIAKSVNVEAQVNIKKNTMADLRKEVATFREKYGLTDTDISSMEAGPKKTFAEQTKGMQEKLMSDNPDWDKIEQDLYSIRNSDELDSLGYSSELKNSLVSDIKRLRTTEGAARVVINGSVTSLSNDEIMEKSRAAHLKAQVNSQAYDTAVKFSGEAIGASLDFSATATEDVNMANLEKDRNRLEAIEAQMRQDVQQITNTIASIQSLLEKTADSGTRAC